MKISHKHSWFLIGSLTLAGIFFIAAIIFSIFAFLAKKENGKQLFVNNIICINNQYSIIHDTCYIPVQICSKPRRSITKGHKERSEECDTIYKYVTVKCISK